MKHKTLIKLSGKVILLILIPILLLIRLKWDAILPIIIYLQFLLIWAQAEISLRQQVLFSMQLDPHFSVKLQEDVLILTNMSNNPAYNIMIGRILNEQTEPIPPQDWKNKISSNFISSLAPNEQVQLCSVRDVDFLKSKTIEISYTNQLGEWKQSHIKILEKMKFLVVPPAVKLPGILLGTLEEFSLFLKFIQYKKYFKQA